MKKIKFISTGGTIAMNENENGKLEPEFSGVELINGLPELKKICKIDAYEFSNIDSSQMTPEIMFKLTQLVAKNLESPEIDGVVITHGTDTLEETAYMMDLIIDNSKPVVITGAMRGALELSSDGQANLYQAFQVAVNDKSREQGVLVVLNNEIHTAKLLTKRHSTNLAAFTSINSGKIGEISDKKVNYFYNARPSSTIKTKNINNEVILLKIVPGFEPFIIDTLLNNNELDFKGLVIEAYGSGAIPSNIVPSLERSIERGIKVVLTSRCLEGDVHNIYAASGGKKDPEELGIIFSQGLNGQKARIKLMLMLGGDYLAKEIKDSFHS